MLKLKTIVGFSALALCSLSSLAYADDPKFEYGKSDDLKDVKSVIWKAAAQAGFVFTSGNSHTTTITGGLVASRKEGDNKFSVEANAAYGKSQLRIAQDLDGNNLLSPDEIQTVNQQTTNNWLAKARYDRFLTAQNSVFVTARVGADQIAGKDLIFGAQLGYSRLIYKDENHELAGEAGYDFSYESYAAPDVDALSIHSARLFVGYTGKLSTETSVGGAVEWLTNLNAEDKAPNDVDGDGNAGNDPVGVDALKDNRITGKAELTTKLRTNISFRVALAMKYDSAPAPLPNVKGSDGYVAGYQPIAEDLDTTAEAQLIVDLL
jgi:hypothetical protein